jgi:hypothetical protein
VDGRGDGVLRTTSLGGPKPPLPGEDKGDYVETPLLGCPDGLFRAMENGVVKSGVDENGQPLRCDPDPAYASDIPAETAAALDYLYRRGGTGDNSPDERAFDALSELVGEKLIPSRSLPALFDAAAKIPGSTVERGMKDFLGRAGVAVIHDDHGERHAIIFDEKTFEYIGEGSIDSHGRLMYNNARIRIGIVDRPGELPRSNR